MNHYISPINNHYIFKSLSTFKFLDKILKNVDHIYENGSHESIYYDLSYMLNHYFTVNLISYDKLFNNDLFKFQDNTKIINYYFLS